MYTLAETTQLTYFSQKKWLSLKIVTTNPGLLYCKCMQYLWNNIFNIVFYQYYAHPYRRQPGRGRPGTLLLLTT